MHASAPVLSTQRLTLRPHRKEDFARYAEMFGSNRARFMGGPLSRQDAWRSFVCDAGQWSIYGNGAWAIEITSTREFAGQVAVAQPVHFPEIELGWFLFHGFQGKGYAFEAAQRARQFAFRDFGVTTLVSYIDPANAPSITLAKRLGARLDPDAVQPNDSPTLVFRHPSI